MKLSGPHAFRRLLTGLDLILAPLLLLGGTLLAPESGGESRDYLRALADEPGRGELSAVLSFLGFAALVGAIFGLIQLVRDRGVILGHVGGWLAAFGAIAFVGLVTTTFYDLSIAENAPLALGERISEGVEDYEGALVVLLPAIIGLPVGLILLTLSLHRRRLAPIWVPVVIAAAAVVLTVGGDSKVAGVVGSLLFLAGLGYLGLTVLRMTDQEWAGAPPPVPAP